MRQCLIEFCITKNDIYQLADVLQIPMKITCCQRTVSPDIEGICMLLKRLAYPLSICGYGSNIWEESIATVTE